MSDLDIRQRLAVEAGPVDLFVAAGAGSGKTRVLTARFVAAVLGTPPYAATEPEQILTVTYTEKAAGELAERVRLGLVDAGRPDAARKVSDGWISTIHGMCSRILRQHALDAGIDPRFRVLDQVETSVLTTELLDSTLGDLMRDDPGVARLAAAYSFDAVAAALRSVRADLAAAGLDARSLRVMDEADVLARARLLARSASDIAEAITALRGTKTTEANAVSARMLSAALSALAEDGATASEALLTALPGITFRQLRSIEGHEDLVEAAKDVLSEGRMCAAQLAASPYEQAFLTALEQFSRGYAEAKRHKGVLDFEDLQTHTASLLERRDDVARRYRSQFAMLMVDEFQDTNALQLRIVDRLSSGDLCTVGDENQSIYSFRHADVGVFRSRARSITNRVELDINYRIASPLLTALNGLFGHPELFGNEFMRLRSPEGESQRPPWPSELPRLAVRFVDTARTSADSRAAEATAIAERVVEYVRAGSAPGEIAVLMGALSGGRGAGVERELTLRGIPAVLSAGGAFFECPEVMQARAMLRVIDNVRDDEALLAVLAGCLTRLDPEALVVVRRHAARSLGSAQAAHLWSGLPAAADELGGRDGAAIRRTIDAVESARARQGIRPLSDTVLEPLLGMGMDQALLAEDRGGARRWANVLKLAQLADEFESASSGGLGGFLRYLDLREAHSTGEQEATLDGEGDAVRIMSIHAAKGLEFPVVVVGSLTSESSAPPIQTARHDGAPLLGLNVPVSEGWEPTLAWRAVSDAKRSVREAEKRRLFYVACTRARESLTVVGRTRSDRPADASITGVLRTIFGMAEADSLEDRDIALGEGYAEVGVVCGPTEAAPAQAAASAPVGQRSAPRGDGGSAIAPAERIPLTADPAPGSPVAPLMVSYTALAAYERCPYSYYLTRVAGLEPPPRAGATTTLDVGSAVHLVLQRCDDGAAMGPAVSAAVTATGLSPEHRPSVERAARSFLISVLAERVRDADRAYREVPFLVSLEDAVLSGAIDLIAWKGDGAMIVDYKTGAGQLSEEEARRRYQLQAECYAIAAIKAGAVRVEVVFTELERDREIDFSFGSEDIPRLIARLDRLVAAIAAGEFSPLNEYVHGLCDVCPGFGGLCGVRRPVRGASE